MLLSLMILMQKFVNVEFGKHFLMCWDFYWGTKSAWHLKEENPTLKPKQVESGDEKG